MRCDDPGGVCAADQPHRAGSEQMREKEGDTRQKGEEWRRERQSAEQCPLPLHRLHGGSSKRDRITASPVETAGMVQSNIQHCAQRILCELDTEDICEAEDAAETGWRTRWCCCIKRGRPPLVHLLQDQNTSSTTPPPPQDYSYVSSYIGVILTSKMFCIKQILPPSKTYIQCWKGTRCIYSSTLLKNKSTL